MKKLSKITSKQKYIFGIILVLAFLAIISIVIGIFTSFTYFQGYRIVFGTAYVLFLPGFILSYCFFPRTKSFDRGKREKGSVDWIERIALSFALSIAVVPLVVFYLNLIGLAINLLNSFLTILGVIVISTFILILRLNRISN